MDQNRFETSGPHWLHDVDIMRKFVPEDDPTPPASPGGSYPMVDPEAREEFEPQLWQDREFNRAPHFIDTCHNVAMSALFYFQQMDKYWERNLPNLEVYERNQIFAGMRCDLPLVVIGWATPNCALITEPDQFTFKLDNHPDGHGIIVTRTYNRGVIKLDDRLFLDLDQEYKLTKSKPEGMARDRALRNVRILQAAIFYSFAFQLADLIAPYNCWMEGDTTAEIIPEGGVLMHTLFGANPQLWKDQRDNLHFVVKDETGNLVVLDERAVCKPLFYADQTSVDNSLDKFGLTMRDRSKISTDLPIPLKARTFEELYANPQPLRNDGRWYWEYLWKMCKEDDKPRRRFFIDRAQWRPGPPTELRIASPDFAELCRTRMSEQSEQSQE